MVLCIHTQRDKDYMAKELPRQYLGSTDKFGEQTSINTGYCKGETHFSYHWNSFSSFGNAMAFAARNKGFPLPASQQSLLLHTWRFLNLHHYGSSIKAAVHLKKEKEQSVSCSLFRAEIIPVFNLQPTVTLLSFLEKSHAEHLWNSCTSEPLSAMKSNAPRTPRTMCKMYKERASYSNNPIREWTARGEFTPC